jgi:hypothetical protein
MLLKRFSYRHARRHGRGLRARFRKCYSRAGWKRAFQAYHWWGVKITNIGCKSSKPGFELDDVRDLRILPPLERLVETELSEVAEFVTGR